jgi:hypothetical protein
MNDPFVQEPPLFEEVQRFDQLWFRLLLGALAAAGLYFIIAGSYIQLVQGIPFGNKPLPDMGLVAVNVLFFLLGVALPVALMRLKLEVRLDRHALIARYWPLAVRKIPLPKIKSWEARTYRPIRDYGGWGVRYSLTQRHWVYNVKGNRGVLLELADGKKFMLGSQRAEELAQALAEAKQG